MAKADLLDRERYGIPKDVFALGRIERGRGGDGYDVMAAAEKDEPGWYAISSWGADGWDLGDWPYVVIYYRRTPDQFQLAYYVEGDVDTYGYATQEELHQAIDYLAFFHWRSLGFGHVAGIETADDAPPELCGHYSRFRKPIAA